MADKKLQSTIYKGHRINYLLGTIRGKKVIEANWTSRITGDISREVGVTKQAALLKVQKVIDRDIQRSRRVRVQNRRSIRRRKRRIIQGKTPLVPARFRLSGGYGAGSVRADEDIIFELGGRF